MVQSLWETVWQFPSFSFFFFFLASAEPLALSALATVPSADHREKGPSSAVWQFLTKLNVCLPDDRAVPLLVPKRNENLSSHSTCPLMFRVALLVMGTGWKRPSCPSAGEWINWFLHTVEHFVAVKRNGPVVSESLAVEGSKWGNCVTVKGSTREYLGLKELFCILIVMVVKLHRLTTLVLSLTT